MSKSTNKNKEKKGYYIVKPINRFGLDYLHLLLIVLVLVLIAVILVESRYKPAVIIEKQNVTYNQSNISVNISYNSSIRIAERYLASLTRFSGSSLFFLPFLIDSNAIRSYYIKDAKEWLVIVPYKDPFYNNNTYNATILINATDGSVIDGFTTPVESNISENYAVGNGLIELYNKVSCSNSSSVPVYLITDPYAPGAFNAIEQLINISYKYNILKPSYYFIFSRYSASFYKQYGVEETQQLGFYLACAARQQNFSRFVSNIKQVYSGVPLSNSSLSSIAKASGLNITQLDSCLEYNATSLLNGQLLLSQFYNVTFTPVDILECKYETIPLTLNQSIRYIVKS